MWNPWHPAIQQNPWAPLLPATKNAPSINDSIKYFIMGIRWSFFVYSPQYLPNMLIIFLDNFFFFSLDYTTINIVVPMVGIVQACILWVVLRKGFFCDYGVMLNRWFREFINHRINQTAVLKLWYFGLFCMFLIGPDFVTFLLHWCNFNGLHMHVNNFAFNNHIYFALILNIL